MMHSQGFHGQEEAVFLSLMTTLGLTSDSAQVSNARAIWVEAKKYAVRAPVDSMEKVSILKEVNVRASASSGAVLPGAGAQNEPEEIRKALADAILQATEADRVAFEGFFPPSVLVEFDDETKLYRAIDPSKTPEWNISNGDHSSAFKSAVEGQNACWIGWIANGLNISEKLESSDKWKTLHICMTLQRDHHRNVSTALRKMYLSNIELLQEVVEVIRTEPDLVPLTLRINSAVQEGARGMLSGDALALKGMGANMPWMTSDEAMQVKRLEFDRFGDAHEDEFGLYVRASDFDALVAQLIHQGEIQPVEAVMYLGLRGNTLLQFPDEPAPTNMGSGRIRKIELRRSAHSFETLTARLAAYEGLLATADDLIRGYASGEVPAGASSAKIQKFNEDYQAAQQLAEKE